MTESADASAGVRLNRRHEAVRQAIHAAAALSAFVVATLLTSRVVNATVEGVILGIALPAMLLVVTASAFERFAPGAGRARWSASGVVVAVCALAVYAWQTANAPWTAAQAIVAGAVYIAITSAFFDGRAGLKRPKSYRPHAQRAVVIGSKDAASAVLRLLAARADLPFDVVGCLDDSTSRRSVEGVPVLGGIDRLPAVVSRLGIGCVIIASTNLAPEKIRSINEMCAQLLTPEGARIIIKVMPEVADVLMGSVRVSRMRDVCLEDLLQRKGVNVDAALAAPHLRNQVVLVTGAGGSIGGEICRQIAAFEPKLLLLLGHGENSLFTIDQELRSVLGFDRTRIIVADVGDAARVRRVFARFRPHLVFHAAAHKHVPIVEENVCEAVRNNVIGTQVVALAAAASGVAKFVMISTDKAVNPTSMMGATKRAAEMICQSFERRTGTEFVSVRFGNVLGSRGSVIHTFKRQIESGGPVTVTHPDMVRYFMTIPEAVRLVLEAMAIGRDGQVFVMDMGEPVRVAELAENLISLSGLRPYQDIDIVFSGIRPGEKLFEEILTARERENPTVNAHLFMAQQERIEYERLSDLLMRLDLAVRTPDAVEVVGLMRRLVPSYTPSPLLLKRDELAPVRAVFTGVSPIQSAHNGGVAAEQSHDGFDAQGLAEVLDAGN